MEVRYGTMDLEGWFSVDEIIPVFHRLLSLQCLRDVLQSNSNRLRGQGFGPSSPHVLLGPKCQFFLPEDPKIQERYPLGYGQELRSPSASDRLKEAGPCCSGYHPKE